MNESGPSDESGSRLRCASLTDTQVTQLPTSSCNQIQFRLVIKQIHNTSQVLSMKTILVDWTGDGNQKPWVLESQCFLSQLWQSLLLSPLGLPARNEQTLKLTSRPKLRLFAHHCAGTHPGLHILYEQYDLTSVMVIDTDFLTRYQLLLLFVCEYSWIYGQLMRRNSELTHSTTWRPRWTSLWPSASYSWHPRWWRHVSQGHWVSPHPWLPCIRSGPHFCF